MFRKKEPPVEAEYLVVGLGNPGPEYRGTRHNVGFEVAEKFAKAHRIETKTMRHKAQFGVGTASGHGVAVARPLTYMNLSGSSVNLLRQSLGVPVTHLIVVADDLDLPVGKVRMRLGGSHGGHNGHRSVIASLGTSDYKRIKVGIGKGDSDTVDHVLSRFKPDERNLVDAAVDKCVSAIEAWIAEGDDAAMRVANG